MTPHNDTPAFLRHLAKRGAGSIHPLGRLGTETMVQALQFDPTDKVLEVGCGTGESLVRIANETTQCVSGIDIISAMTECAQGRSNYCGVRDNVDIRYVREKARWPFEDDCFDVVYAESVVAILDRDARKHVFSEVLRTLRGNGRFVFSDAIWRSGTPQEVIQSANDQCREEFGIPQATGDWVGPGECERELNEAGFEEVSAKQLMEILAQTKHVAPWTSEAARRSRRFTFKRRCRAMLSPFFVIDEIKFLMASLRLREIGQAIEAWLFQSQKPFMS